MDKYNYTVIIPTKNIPNLLTRALNTIPQREDVQVIVVDDNSDSNMVDFDHYPGLDRKNTKVIFNKDGLGAGHARNVGLQHAEGKWLLFMDSDDLYMENAFHLLDGHLDDNYDIVFFGITSMMSDDLSPCDRHKLKMSNINRFSYDKKQLDFYCRYFYTEPWGKMIRRELVTSNGIEFDESLVANDYMFSVKTGYYAKTTYYDSRVLYCVTERNGSICNNIYESSPKIQSRLLVYYNVQLFFESKSIKLFPLTAFFMIMNKQGEFVRKEKAYFIKTHKVNRFWIARCYLINIVVASYRKYCNRFLVSYNKAM